MNMFMKYKVHIFKKGELFASFPCAKGGML